MERLTVTVPEMAQMLGIGRIKAYELAKSLGTDLLISVGWAKE